MKLKRNSWLIKAYLYLNQKLYKKTDLPQNTCDLSILLFGGLWLASWVLVVFGLFIFAGGELGKYLWQSKEDVLAIVGVSIGVIIALGILGWLAEKIWQGTKYLSKKIKPIICKDIEIED